MDLSVTVVKGLTQRPSAVRDRLARCASFRSELQSVHTSLTQCPASGAGVHRVEAHGRVFVLKVAADAHSAEEWRRTLYVVRSAADVGLAPRVMQVDEERRALVSDFVVDQLFPRLHRDPTTHDPALSLLGETLRRVYALPVLPIAANAVVRVLAEEPPPTERTPVFSHNDPNPTNVVLGFTPGFTLGIATMLLADRLVDRIRQCGSALVRRRGSPLLRYRGTTARGA
jgi:hypothetical protein